MNFYFGAPFFFFFFFFFFEHLLLFCLTGCRCHPCTHPSLADSDVCFKRITTPSTKYQDFQGKNVDSLISLKELQKCSFFVCLLFNARIKIVSLFKSIHADYYNIHTWLTPGTMIYIALWITTVYLGTGHWMLVPHTCSNVHDQVIQCLDIDRKYCKLLQLSDWRLSGRVILSHKLDCLDCC